MHDPLGATVPTHLYHIRCADQDQSRSGRRSPTSGRRSNRTARGSRWLRKGLRVLMKDSLPLQISRPSSYEQVAGSSDQMLSSYTSKLSENQAVLSASSTQSPHSSMKDVPPHTPAQSSVQSLRGCRRRRTCRPQSFRDTRLHSRAPRAGPFDGNSITSESIAGSSTTGEPITTCAYTLPSPPAESSAKDSSSPIGKEMGTLDTYTPEMASTKEP